MSKARLVITAVVVQGRAQAEVARSYGISAAWVSRLVARYRAEGEAAFEPRSRRPHTSPTALPAGVIEQVILERDRLTNAGHDAGPETIAWHLRTRGITVSRASIARVLTNHGRVIPQPKKRPRSSYRTFTAAMPNECWQSDFTQWEGEPVLPVRGGWAGSTEISLTRVRLVPGADGCSLHQLHRIHEVSYVGGGPARSSRRANGW